MLHSLRRSLIITRREVVDQFRGWRIIVPVILLTLFFPLLMNFTAKQAVNFVARYGASVVGDRLIPFLLMVVGFFPMSVSLVIALESFVGEKERRTIEPLLSSPLTDGQLYLGKLLAAMAPPLFASYLGITVYLIGVYVQIDWRPPPILLAQILLLTTIQAVVMVAGAIVISSQTTSVRAANLLASFIIIPMALLIQGESVVMFWAQYSTLWWIVVALCLIALVLIRTGVAYFNREELLGRELDTLNLGWGWSVFKTSLKGKGRNLLHWYRTEVFQALGSMKLAILCSTLVMLLGIWVGIDQSRQFALPPDLLSFDNINQGFVEGLESVQFISPMGAGIVWLHNLRVLLIATLLGIFSFGVLGLLVVMLPVAFIAYMTANVMTAGLSPVTFLLALVLPHGILELPAIVLTGAAILNLGATLVTPSRGKTISEAFLTALARWAKVIFGLVIPLFLLAAFLEVYLTPRVAVWLLGS
jgi:uncharacterized membrane protein SpoIIM required for sporulation/ABC-type transport system involved in multi-copper enzyme maturation permease subunit